MKVFNNIYNRKGFTIVELLVVIVVIGILATITIVSYTGITGKANTVQAQSAASATIDKINVYSTDMGGFPTSYGSLTGAAATSSYYMNGMDFTTISGNTVMAAKPAIADAVDFSLCGTNAGAVPASYSAITIATGIKLGYWDHMTPALNTTKIIGTTSGGNVTCFKVGIAEAVIAVAKALYSESGTSTWPATSAAINANTAVSAKLPVGVTTILVNPTGANMTTQVKFECGSAVASTPPCNNTGGRITFWNGTAPQAVTYGTAVNFWVPLT